ncbi:MAG: hypothetical protein GX129_05590 [Clostridiales bacterium]|jgi:lactate dehydrogenase-like 2-hydroxyacid dehydrogenase|nr:hypothetical protein [Clostridiales bacterium]
MIYLFITTIIIIIIQAYFVIDLQKKNRYLKVQEHKKDKSIELNKSKYDFMLEWVAIHKLGYSLANHLERSGYHRIAIYGMGEIGYLIYDALKDSNVEVIYFIDNNADNLYHSLPVYKLKDNLPSADVILISIFGNIDSVTKELKKKIGNVLNITEAINSVGLEQEN